MIDTHAWGAKQQNQTLNPLQSAGEHSGALESATDQSMQKLVSPRNKTSDCSVCLCMCTGVICNDRQQNIRKWSSAQWLSFSSALKHCGALRRVWILSCNFVSSEQCMIQMLWNRTTLGKPLAQQRVWKAETRFQAFKSCVLTHAWTDSGLYDQNKYMHA